jgi:hypothetical protein
MHVPRARTSIAVLLAVVAVAGLAAWQPQSAAAADLTADYTWDFVKIGGWTWFTNIWVHPGGNGPVYNNSDTACPYRWDEANQKWIPIVTADTMPDPGGFLFDYDWETTDGDPGQPGPNGLSVVGAPSNPNVAYLAYCDRLATGDMGNVYRSTNQGDTWTLPGGGTLNIFMAPNGTARQSGPRLAVDPADEDVVYFGSQKDGLWRSTDGAATWSLVTGVPVPSNEEGVACVDFDPNSGTTGGLTNTIYAAVSGQGVYRTTDAGASWTDIGGPTAWANAAKVGGDGTYYIVDNGGVLNRYTGSWTNISPGTVYGVAVDPFNANRVVAVNTHSATYLSTNKGDNWTQLDHSVDYNGIASHTQRTGVDRLKIAFDTGVQDKLWAVEAYGLWQCDLSAGTAAWKCNAHGTEGYCTETIIKPPGGGIISGIMDGGVYYHPDPATYDSVQVCSPDTNQWLYEHGWGSDYCVAQPSFVAAINGPPHQWSEELSGYSNDKGKQDTWTKFSSTPGYQPTTPAGLAISATDPNNIVIYDASQNKAYSTTNCGGSWSSSGFGTPLMTGWGPGDGAIAADRVDGGTFYVYDWADSEIWRTTDGGDNWAAVGAIPGGANYSDISATPNRAGHVWFCFNCGLCGTVGLLRSTDYGATWSYVNNVDYANSICFGRALLPTDYPTIYLYGTVGGVEGVWRSTDEAVTWDKIANVAPMGLYATCLSSAGDQEIFGRCYFNTRGMGSAWGDCGGGGVPIANNDEYSTYVNTPLSVPAPGVLDNDEDLDNDPLTAILVDDVSNGSLTLNSNGSFDYTPNTDYIGDDEFTYKANDGTADSNVATVSIHVTGTGTTMHVAQIANITKQGGRNPGCTAEVLILDNDGWPVPNAIVWVTFSGGGCQGSASAATGGDGWATVVITGLCHQIGCYTCVDDVTHESLTYDPAQNVVTCCDVDGNCTGPPDTTPPAAPTNLTATAAGSSQINLAWDDNSEPDLDSYNVYRSDSSGGPYDQVASGVAQSAHSDTGLSPLTTYYYVVTAVDTSDNESAESNEASATTSEGGGEGTCHVASITVTIVPVAGPRSKARAEVVILDDQGAPVENATVAGTFTGDVSGSGSDDTDASGLAVIESKTANNVTSVTFCVDSVTHGTLTYEPGDNAETCDTN